MINLQIKSIPAFLFLCKWSLFLLLLKELSEAENQFKRMIEHYPNEGLDCLAYCGIGKVYLKKNRLVETTLLYVLGWQLI